MPNNLNKIDTHEELLIQRYGNGVKLIPPSKHAANLSSIKKIFSLPVNVFFTSIDTSIQNINEATAINCGFESIKSAMGKTVGYVAKKETVAFELAHEREVIKTKQMKIKEENYIQLNDNNYSYINIKFPWYNKDNRIIGIFGFSTITTADAISFSEKLSLILKTGLLDQKKNIDYVSQIVPGIVIGDVYLTKRMSEVLQYLVKGQTAKQIANTLQLSTRTIESHIENIKYRMDVDNKSQLIEKVINHFNS